MCKCSEDCYCTHVVYDVNMVIDAKGWEDHIFFNFLIDPVWVDPLTFDEGEG